MRASNHVCMLTSMSFDAVPESTSHHMKLIYSFRFVYILRPRVHARLSISFFLPRKGRNDHDAIYRMKYEICSVKPRIDELSWLATFGLLCVFVLTLSHSKGLCAGGSCRFFRATNDAVLCRFRNICRD